jgi:glutathione S-transferase
MLKLFHCPGVCSLASLIALNEANADFETIIVNLRNGEQNNEEYRAINPKGRVPALWTERGVLTESPAIMTYIANRFPEARLAPDDDPWLYAQMQSFNAFIASSVQPAVGPLGHPERYSADPDAQKSMAQKAVENVTGYFRLIEDELFAGPWVLGEQFSLADCYLYTFSELISRLSLGLEHFPKLIAHRRLMEDRPAVAVSNASGM